LESKALGVVLNTCITLICKQKTLHIRIFCFGGGGRGGGGGGGGGRCGGGGGDVVVVVVIVVIKSRRMR
jgi:hypothetical protein